jgi:hypothetical protein
MLFQYDKTSIRLFEYLTDIKKRLLADVKPYVDIVQNEAEDHRGMGNFSLIRMLMPIVETTARAMAIKPQDLLGQMSIPNPYLSWSIFRDVFMHNDEFETASIEVDGEELTVNPAIGITFPGTPALHTTTSSYQMINLIGLYDGLVTYIDRILSDKNNDKKIKIVTGIKYLDRDNDEVKMIEQEIKAIKSKK